MAKTAKVTISLPEELLRKADAAGEREHRTRSELVREALRWYLRISTLPVSDPTPEEIAAIRAGRAEHARGETLTHADIRSNADLEDRVREEGAKEPRRLPLDDHRRIVRALAAMQDDLCMVTCRRCATSRRATAAGSATIAFSLISI